MMSEKIVICFLVLLIFASCSGVNLKEPTIGVGVKHLNKPILIYYEASCGNKNISISGLKFSEAITLENSLCHDYYVDGELIYLELENPPPEFYVDIVTYHYSEIDTVRVYIIGCLRKLSFNDFENDILDTIPVNCSSAKELIVPFNGTVGFLTLTTEDTILFKKKGYSTIDGGTGYSLNLDGLEEGIYTLISESRHGIYDYSFFLDFGSR